MAQQTYQPADDDHNYNLNPLRMCGISNMMPQIHALVGGALLRALMEHGATGLAQDQFATGLPSAACPALTAADSVLLVGSNFVDPFRPDEGDWRFVGDVIDGQVYRVRISDSAYTPASPTAPLPTIRTWCENLGGTYFDSTQP